MWLFTGKEIKGLGLQMKPPRMFKWKSTTFTKNALTPLRTEILPFSLQISIATIQGFKMRYTANICSQTAVEVHWKTCLLSKSTDLWLQFFYKYFIVLVANNNCYYYRYFNAFVNAGKLKCKVQLITALWNTEKLM